MTRMTPQEYADWLMQTARQHNAMLTGEVAINRNPEPMPELEQSESDLHRQIRQECRYRRLLAFSGAFGRRTRRTMGEPDFIVLGPSGRVWLVECKTGHGKLTPGQQAVSNAAATLGHTVHVVRSLEEFIALTSATGSAK